MNIANKLTLFRVILVPFFVFFMLTDFLAFSRWIAFGIFCIATATDKLDGTIAKRYNMVTNFGKFMDPIADKLLVCSALICLTATNEIPVWATIIIIAREFSVSGIRLVAADNGVAIAASWWGKSKTIAQMVMIIIILADLSFMEIPEKILLYVSVLLTLISAVDYIIKNKKAIAFDTK